MRRWKSVAYMRRRHFFKKAVDGTVPLGVSPHGCSMPLYRADRFGIQVEKALAVVVCKLDREALEAVWRFVRAQHDKIVLIIRAKPLF